jgi:phosphatidylinositol glycan class A protein
VISTSVGGIPEVLPNDLIQLAEPSVSALVHELDIAINKCITKSYLPPQMLHDTVKKLYTWQNVARRTEKVYDAVIKEKEVSFEGRIVEYLQTGRVAGKVFIFIAAMNYLFLLLLNLWYPERNIERAPRFPFKKKLH